MLLWMKLAHECASRCHTSATMDCKTVQGRVRTEGQSFLTISLPDFGKSFEQALDEGQVARHHFAGFRRRAGLPLFLGGYLEQVFARDGGRLLDEPNVDAIHAIRQLTLLAGKLLTPTTRRRTEKAMLGYIECEQEVRIADAARSSADIADFERVSALLFASAFSKVDRKIYYGEVLPKHGPGATADRLSGNRKWRQSSWTTRLEEVFPSGEFLLPNWRYYDQLETVDLLEPGSETPVRIISVPKTQRTPRIIGIEPTAMQYAQQGVLLLILQALIEDDYLWSMLGFADQTPNQRMACEGSLTGELATLDLSEASDRVSNQLVRSLLRNHRHMHKAVDACRSRKADVRGHGVIRLAKFASMGSALTFPLEAAIFLTAIFVGIERELGRPLTKRDVKSLRGRVRVYGDDIIVPVDFVESVVDALSLFGAKVNVHKSFWNGKFRESCGKEFYDGQDVSVVRVRRESPAQLTDAAEIISLVSLRNQLYFAGFWQTCKWLDERLRSLLRGKFPVVLPTSSALGRHSFLGYETQGMDRKLHRPFVKAYEVSSRPPLDPLDGSSALLKCLLMMERREVGRRNSAASSTLLTNLNSGVLPDAIEDHLERSGRPQRVDIKLGKVCPY